MPDSHADQRKPRLWLRLLLVLIGLAAIIVPLAYAKFLQIQEKISMGSQTPPPISVTVATAEPAEWSRKVKAIGTLVAIQGVDITTEVSGIVKSIRFESGQEADENALLVELDDRTEQANLESARIELGFTRIYSPINGIIGKTMVFPGDYVGKGINNTALNEVSRIDTILVKEKSILYTGNVLKGH